MAKKGRSTFEDVIGLLRGGIVEVDEKAEIKAQLRDTFTLVGAVGLVMCFAAAVYLVVVAVN